MRMVMRSRVFILTGFLAVAGYGVSAEIDPAAVASLFAPVERVEVVGDGWLARHLDGSTTRLTRHGADLVAQTPDGKVVRLVRSGDTWRVQGGKRWISGGTNGRYRVRGGSLIRNSGAGPKYLFRGRQAIRDALR